MKEVECKHLCIDADAIENDVEVDDDNAFVCDASNNIALSVLFGAPKDWSLPTAPEDWTPPVNSMKGEPAFNEVDYP